MMAEHPRDLRIEDFTYHLPEDRIARYPLPRRDDSKLLVYRNGTLAESRYRYLDAQLPANSLLVFNNTRVVEARLLFQKPTGGSLELFCLEPAAVYPDITTALAQRESVEWKCLVGGAKKWKDGPLIKQLEHNGRPLTLSAEKIAKQTDCYLIRFQWSDPLLSFAELLHLAGILPLPPYLNRQAEAPDQQRYQTIYAEHDGSVAAPTAGLHFTPELLLQLNAKHIRQEYVTLHVGAGTFKPVKSDTMEGHEMHAEFIDVSIETIRSLYRQLQQTIVAVGTTSLRTLESLYWLGIQVLHHPSTTPVGLQLTQWAPYQPMAAPVPAAPALAALLQWMEQWQLTRVVAKTQLIIAPGYRLRIVKGLITNFHQPQSTLLLLVAAITGLDWKRIYTYALEHDFRFLSYGDGCLLWNAGGAE